MVLAYMLFGVWENICCDCDCLRQKMRFTILILDRVWNQIWVHLNYLVSHGALGSEQVFFLLNDSLLFVYLMRHSSNNFPSISRKGEVNSRDSIKSILNRKSNKPLTRAFFYETWSRYSFDVNAFLFVRITTDYLGHLNTSTLLSPHIGFE